MIIKILSNPSPVGVSLGKPYLHKTYFTNFTFLASDELVSRSHCSSIPWSPDGIFPVLSQAWLSRTFLVTVDRVTTSPGELGAAQRWQSSAAFQGSSGHQPAILQLVMGSPHFYHLVPFNIKHRSCYQGDPGISKWFDQAFDSCITDSASGALLSTVYFR